MNKKIAIIDPSSYSLPYDYFYVNEVSKYFKVDFYYSTTNSNYEYIEKLKYNENIELHEYQVTPSEKGRLIGVINYFKMLIHLARNRKSYHAIHFIWNIAFILEPFSIFLK